MQRPVMHFSGSVPYPEPLDERVDSQAQNQDAEQLAEDHIGNSTQESNTPKGSDEHTDDRQGQNGPRFQDWRRFDREINRHAGAIDDQRNGGGRRNQRLLLNVKAEQGRGTNAALVADQSAEEPGERSGKPGHTMPEAQAIEKSAQAGDSRENQQTAKDDRQYGTVSFRVQQCSKQSSGGAQDSEVAEDSSIEPVAQSDKPGGRCKQMGNRDDGNGQLRSITGSKNWR